MFYFIIFFTSRKKHDAFYMIFYKETIYLMAPTRCNRDSDRRKLIKENASANK